MSLGATIVRLLRAVATGVSVAIGVAIVYAIVDLYLAGHSIAVPHIRGHPLHQWLADIVVIVAPLGAAAFTFWRGRPRSP